MISKENILRHADFVLLGLFIAAMPLPYRYSNYILMPLILYWLITKKFRVSFAVLKKSTILKLFCGLFIIISLSIVTSENFNWQFNHVEKYLQLMAIPFIFCSLNLSAKQLNRILLFFFVGSCCICAVYSLISTFIVYEMSLEEILTKRATLSYFSWVLPETLHLKSNYYSLYIGFCLVILLENILLTSNRNYRIILMLPFCFLFLFLGLLSSRMSFLAVAIFLTVWLCKFLFERKFRAKSLLIIGSTVLFLIILTLQFPFLHSKISGVLEQGTQSDPRYMLFQCGWQIFTDNFFFGAGISDVEELAIICYESVNNTIAIDEQYNFHNVFLQWAASTGLVGLLIFTILLVLLFARAVKMNKMVPLGFIFLFFMASLTESLLTRNKGLIFFITFSTVFFIRQPYEEDTSR